MKYRPLIVLCIAFSLDRLFFGYDSYNLRFCLFYVSYFGYEWFSLYRIRGELGATSIKKPATGQEVHLEEIDEIVADTSLFFTLKAKAFITYIYTQKDTMEETMEVALSGEDLLVLADGKDNLVIGDGTLSIAAGREDEDRKILFRFLGRHYTHNHIIPFFILVPLGAINEKAEVVPYQFVFLLVLLLAGMEMLKYWQKVAVILDDAGIRVNEGRNREWFIAYGDVAKVEKGLIHTTVMTKTGEVFRFPQAWALMPELIRKFAGW